MLATSLLLIAVTLGQENAAQEDLKRMQGTWVMVALEVNGKDVQPAKLESASLKIDGERYAVTNKVGTIACALRLDPAKEPRAVDMVFAQPGGGEKILKGIYRFRDGQLQIARGLNADQERPGQFATWPETNYFVVTWQREK